jgi:hypothetical protein
MTSRLSRSNYHPREGRSKIKAPLFSSLMPEGARRKPSPYSHSESSKQSHISMENVYFQYIINIFMAPPVVIRKT